MKKKNELSCLWLNSIPPLISHQPSWLMAQITGPFCTKISSFINYIYGNLEYLGKGKVSSLDVEHKAMEMCGTYRGWALSSSEPEGEGKQVFLFYSNIVLISGF